MGNIATGSWEILASSVISQRYYPTPKAVLRCQQGKSEFVNQEMSVLFLCRLVEMSL